MKPIVIVKELQETTSKRCFYCAAAPPGYKNLFLCTKNLSWVTAHDSWWDGVTEPCTKEDWGICPLNRKPA